MNFHIFVAIITCVFYVFLRIYKYNLQEGETKRQNDKKRKSKSNLLYIFFIPIVLYITHFLYYKSNENNITKLSSKEDSLKISEDLLSIPYPESSFRSSNLN